MPTSDIQAEQAVLCAMMTNPAAIVDATEILGPGDFWRPAHAELFRAMVAMLAQGEPVDPITLRAYLAGQGIRPREYGGPDGEAYLAHLYTLGWPAVNCAYHARIVWECSVRRHVGELGTRMAQQARELDVPPDELIARAQKLLTTLAEHATPDSGGPVSAQAFISSPTLRSSPVIPGLLDHEDRVVVVAAEGVGKTTLAYQVGYALAAGTHPFVHREQIKPGRVLLIDLENPSGILQRRLGKLMGIAAEHPGWNPDNVSIWHRPGGINLERPADQFRLAEVVRLARPDLLIAGPTGKMIHEREHGEHLHGYVTRFFDLMRERYGCAIWLEAHAPIASGGPGGRLLRPKGSGIWSSWPEFGVALARPAKSGRGTAQALIMDRFRGDREEGRAWPERIERNDMPYGWPWKAVYPDGTFDTPLDAPDDPWADESEAP